MRLNIKKFPFQLIKTALRSFSFPKQNLTSVMECGIFQVTMVEGGIMASKKWDLGHGNLGIQK